MLSAVPCETTINCVLQFSAVTNLEYLGVPVYKRASSGSSLFFNRKRKRNTRKVGSVCLALVSFQTVLGVGIASLYVQRQAPPARSAAMHLPPATPCIEVLVCTLHWALLPQCRHTTVLRQPGCNI